MMKDRAERIKSLNCQIGDILLEQMPQPGIYTTGIAGFNLVRREDGNTLERCFERPLAGLVIRGTKHSIMSGHEYWYGENQSIVAGVDMPISSSVSNASPAAPFLFLYIYLDRDMLASLAYELKNNFPASPVPTAGVSIADGDPELLEMFLRLLELNEKPEQISLRAPMILRELHYLLLIGPHGSLLRHLHTPGGLNNSVVKAIDWIKENFKSPMRVENLARDVGMSVASLHRHFKNLTGFSPLRYQKRLRLFEAQRLMVVENERASNAAFAVGYESINQFSREYKKIFGEPPLRDVMRRRALV